MAKRSFGLDSATMVELVGVGSKEGQAHRKIQAMMSVHSCGQASSKLMSTVFAKPFRAGGCRVIWQFRLELNQIWLPSAIGTTLLYLERF